MKILVVRVHQEEILKACLQGIGSSQVSTILAGHVGREKISAMVAVRQYFPHNFKCTTEIIKYCALCHHVNTMKLQKGHETLYPIPVPLKVGSQNGIDLLGPLKETDG